MNNEIVLNACDLEGLLLGCGIIIDPDAKDEEIPMDSIMFISMIVELENQYGIHIPDDRLLYKYWKTFNLITENVTQLLEE